MKYHKEDQEDYELMLEEVKKEIEWYDLDISKESLNTENKLNLLKKKSAILSGLFNKS